MSVFKMHKCKECGTPYKQYNSLVRYCSPQCKAKNAKPKEHKKPTPIKKQSDKRKVQELQYLADRKVFLAKPENAKCPITGWPTTDIHHMKGRIGDLLLNQRYWIALSREGHQHVEDNPEWAKENGYSLNRLTND